MFYAALTVVVFLMYFLVGNWVVAKSVSDGVFKWTLITYLIWCPMIPAFFWAFKWWKEFGNDKIWVPQIVLLAVNILTSLLMFWMVNGELPSRGTLLGLILAVSGIVVSVLY